jgi:hypothetical protein
MSDERQKDSVLIKLDAADQALAECKTVAFPRDILPTDIDGEIELNGYFLRLEFKYEDCLREGRIPKGQAECFRALLSTGRFTIFYIGQNSFGETTCLQIWTQGNGPKIIDPCNNERLYQACSNWSKVVQAKPSQ